MIVFICRKQEDRKKEFTLIELLAVIVVLAIIVLIAIPIILNIINDAKEQADERSIEMYASAVEKAIAAKQLKEDTKEWQGLETQKNYTDARGYTINYATLDIKARIISAEEITQITGDENWNGFNYYFDTNTGSESDTCKYGNTTGCKYGWLYDRTSIKCKDYGCLNNVDSSMVGKGYWTVFIIDNDHFAWFVNSCGFMHYDYVGTDGSFGMRPVIIVLKSKLS